MESAKLGEQKPAEENDMFDESPEALSRFSLKAKEIDVKRGADGYDDITLKKSTLYAGKFPIFKMPEVDLSYDEEAKQIQYLGPDIGSYRALGGAYAGPGWDFHHACVHPDGCYRGRWASCSWSAERATCSAPSSATCSRTPMSWPGC